MYARYMLEHAQEGSLLRKFVSHKNNNRGCMAHCHAASYLWLYLFLLNTEFCFDFGRNSIFMYKDIHCLVRNKGF